MRISGIDAIGLTGATPAGGWTDELRPDDAVHTLVVVRTDQGLTGVGSVFTSRQAGPGGARGAGAAVRGRVRRWSRSGVSEKLHQSTFWLGPRRAVTHTISGIDIALWDLFGQVTGQPVGRLLGGRYRDRVRPYASLLMDRARRRFAEQLNTAAGARVPRVQDRLGSVRPGR